MPGAEDGPNSWAAWITGTGPGQGAGAVIVESYFRNMVYEDAKWNPLTAKVEVIQRAADEKTARTLNATDPDLRRFQARGGKPVSYTHLALPAVAPAATPPFELWRRRPANHPDLIGCSAMVVMAPGTRSIACFILRSILWRIALLEHVHRLQLS